MTCQFCKQKDATVHLTQIVENEVKKVDLCENCAKEKGVNDPAGFSLADLLLGLGASQQIEEAGDAKGGGLRCVSCGYTQADFKKSGRLGCSDCYDVFADGLDPLLKPMHKGIRHKGKVPGPLRRATDLNQQLLTLEKDLQGAIAREDFEQAAQLRDQLKLARISAKT